jgi:hypothetical protein
MPSYRTILVFLTFFIAINNADAASGKKGLCIPPGTNFHCGDLEAFSRVSWWYNWHTRPNHEVEGYCTCNNVGIFAYMS